MQNLFENVVYLQIRRKRLGVLYLGWGGRKGEYAGAAEVTFAPDRKGRITTRDRESSTLLDVVPGEVFTAFSHPRAFIHDFEKTSSVLAHFIRKAGMRRGLYRAAFVVQVMDEWDGGLTDVEFRALMEMCRELGAGRVLPIEASRELSVPEILQLVRERRGILTHLPISVELR